jgi:uncharacterized membrane protein HdeD (DUF308 family)
MWFGSARTLILRALVAIAFGLALLTWPAISLHVLIALFGAFALVDGALMLTVALELPSSLRTAPLLLAVLGIAIGIAAFLWPGVTALVLLVLIAVRAILVGLAELILASRMRSHASGLWLFAAAGILSIAFGGLLLANPGIGIFALVWVIGAYAVLIGLVEIARLWLLTIVRYA